MVEEDDDGDNDEEKDDDEEEEVETRSSVGPRRKYTYNIKS